MTSQSAVISNFEGAPEEYIAEPIPSKHETTLKYEAVTVNLHRLRPHSASTTWSAYYQSRIEYRSKH